jgi:hypothetical protein
MSISRTAPPFDYLIPPDFFLKDKPRTRRA